MKPPGPPPTEATTPGEDEAPRWLILKPFSCNGADYIELYCICCNALWASTHAAKPSHLRNVKWWTETHTTVGTSEATAVAIVKGDEPGGSVNGDELDWGADEDYQEQWKAVADDIPTTIIALADEKLDDESFDAEHPWHELV